MSASPDSLIAGAHFVNSDEGLEALLTAVEGESSVAIDTEFIREKTYFPKLCLIQLAAARQVWCIDPLAIGDLTPLLDFFDRPQVTKVLHSARQDLEIFYHLRTRVPTPIFDTQIAAALLGYPAQIAYASLVADISGVSLDKSAVRTDWSQRPLQHSQIQYAVGDVAYLAELQRRLSEDLDRLGRLAWLHEECERLNDPAIYSTDPEHAWRRLKGSNRVSDEAFRRLVALARWRETAAIDKDLPRAWIFKDAELIKIALAAPEREEHLTEQCELGPRQVKRWGRTLLEVLDRAHHDTALTDKPNPGAPLNEREKTLFKVIAAVVKRVAEELGIEPTVISNRKDMERATRGARDLNLFSGWRRATVGEEVLEILASETA